MGTGRQSNPAVHKRRGSAADISFEIKNPPEELIQFINNCSKFIIAGHKEPDGDCIGSQLALQSALNRLGKKAFVCSAGPFNRTELRSLKSHFNSIPVDKEITGAKVIIIDCAGKERTGDIQGFLEKFPCAIIDHHLAVTLPKSTLQNPVYVDSNSSSCTLLILKLIKALGLKPTKEEASLLFFGLCTDTGFFRHLTNSNAEVFTAAAELVSCGANPKKIYNQINGGKNLNSRKLTGYILSRTESYFDGKLLISFETSKEYKTLDLGGRDSDTINQLLLSVQDVQVLVIIRHEYADNCTVSLRSVDKINVAQIAASFGGGGHKNAAGLTMKGNISFVKKKMLKTFSNYFIH